MKKVLLVVFCFVAFLTLAGCKGGISGKGEPVSFQDSELAYDAMIEAVEDGDYEKAVEYYNSGAAGTADTDVVNWYFYSKAMFEYEEYGCIGYPLDTLMNNVGDGFDAADEIISEMMNKVRKFNGVYENKGIYLYLSDGKVFISENGQASGTIFCSEEIMCKDDVYYIVEHGMDNSHKILYTLEMTEKGVRLISQDETDNSECAGDYSLIPAEFPELVY